MEDFITLKGKRALSRRVQKVLVLPQFSYSMNLAQQY